MLQNGLGELIRRESATAVRIVDLFAGGGSVAWFAAQETDLPVTAVDLQQYSCALSAAVIARTENADADDIKRGWLTAVDKHRRAITVWQQAVSLDTTSNIVDRVTKSRSLCCHYPQAGPVCRSYGGHYFSPSQALTLDVMLEQLPTEPDKRAICLAAAIMSASKCAAAPGHTAQPFQPTASASKYLIEAWSRDPAGTCGQALDLICPRYARSRGEALVADAIDFACTLNTTDLVIVDPPYTDVQYSRFYHVLETVAQGGCSAVGGVGRYPPREERPQSEFSKRAGARPAITRLLRAICDSGATCILTFPQCQAGNGLSGRGIADIAREMFTVTEQVYRSHFSTMGGNNVGREARRESEELILLLKPQ